MNIKAQCGCGARLDIAPHSGWNQHYGQTQADIAEREAVEKGFALWVEAHRACKQPVIHFDRHYPEPPYPSETTTAAETPLNQRSGENDGSV